MIKKKNKYIAKKKEQLKKLCASIRFSLSFYLKTSLLLLLCLVSTLIPAPLLVFIPILVPTFVSALIHSWGSFTIFLSGCVSTPAVFSALFLSYFALNSYSRSLILIFSCLLPTSVIFYYRIPAFLLPLLIFDLFFILNLHLLEYSNNPY